MNFFSSIWLPGDGLGACGKVGNSLNPNQNAASALDLHYLLNLPTRLLNNLIYNIGCKENQN